MAPCMAELFGKADGCSKGKGGSMHYFDPSRNYWGGHGIVGGQIPLGTGLAYLLNYRLIQDEGATTASTVTYLLPIVAVNQPRKSS